eukprot:CAMPEP_0118662362 /NCGR_PEP_ID=MMETSP0785-20121206/16790_1 /TAXON_ID=91992 /ORGANISM="Bolidomonas pacifica, Strain CCMP 1866" /LENGTH=341 /DNA_ID=CAMNT_0006555899 /DNA_START=71 /DNA_END=1093 /DNA_ORIENTATION=+
MDTFLPAGQNSDRNSFGSTYSEIKGSGGDSEDDHETMFNEKQNQMIMCITIIESSLSFVGSLIIVMSYLSFKRLRKFSLQLVFWLSISDLGNCISYFLGDPKTGWLCTTQSMIMSLFELSSVLWTTVIALTLFRLIVMQKTSSHLMKKFHLFCFGIPFFCMFLPLITDSYGDTGAWCWIQTPEENEDESMTRALLNKGTIWRLVLFYLPLWIAIAFNSVVYIVVTNTLARVARTQASETRPKYLKMIRRLRMYPLILVFCWMGATINRIQNVIYPNDPMFGLYIFQVSTRSLQGVLNAIVYGMNNHVMGEWAMLMGGCLKEKGDSEATVEGSSDGDEDEEA